MPLDNETRSAIDSLLADNPVVLFMKGNRQQPQCGFSAKTVSALDMLVPEYVTIDVLQYPEIREGIKEYGNWPTIPQLYVKGELVGGCDIIQEMMQTGELAEASDAQARQITAASNAVTEISKSMSRVSERAADSAEVARKSVSIAHKGGETVRQTIDGMETIREQIQETSKRIKRLGESSQEIGDIVNLITEISDQTNILALNAAIQASMAGEAGRGFAVVADEVQRLAERTGDATKQIEALVKTIQADTNEASVSMEQSTANVVKGAKLTENAGSALDRIEQVSMNLAQRILEISDATRDQAQDSVQITETMDVIQEITAKTSEGSNRASGSSPATQDARPWVL